MTASDFVPFFQAVHKGHSPFPWQTRLLEEVLSRGWPRSLALPTASGKTGVIDIAVFALACQAGLPPEQRTMPRRIALVVDRRVVVDDAARRAERIANALAAARDGVLGEAADALRSLGGAPEEPLHVAVLRGGLYREQRWARTPVQPTVLLSTVDQVGSRLLFRGYGLSPYAWPIHAGLLANDCLILLDEAHVSRPFLETLSWLERYRARAQQPLRTPFAFVPMTATPAEDDRPTGLPEEDRAPSGGPPNGRPRDSRPFELADDDRQNPVLARRLAACKKARLVEAASARDSDFARELAALAAEHLARGRTVAVVVNRVATARELFRVLQKRPDAQTILLTGRSRPFDRDAILERWRSRLLAGRDRAHAAADPPLVVVATQCIEVGADLDFDVLITECASLDALRQRFGRLDRLGELGSSRAIIAARSNPKGDPDPVYGLALPETWRWLKGNAMTEAGSPVIDFGIDALTPFLPAGEERTRLLAPAEHAPTLFPAYCDLWAHTSPEPVPAPDPAVFLHGFQRGEAEVQVVWRADLGPGQPDTWAETVALCPPSSAEALPLPLWVARAWLAQNTVGAVDADIEGMAAPGAEESAAQKPFRPALRWRGPEDSCLARSAQEVRPGDVLVVPASYGGCDGFGWDPACNEPVTDIAEQVHLAVRRRAVLRLHPGLAPAWGAAEAALRPLCTLDPSAEDADVRAALRDAIARTAAAPGAPGWLRDVCAALVRDVRPSFVPHPDGGWVIVGSRRVAAPGEAADFGDEDAFAARSAVPVPLARHGADVVRVVESFLRDLALPPGLAGDLALAASLHDLGKADPRFQTWLCAGDRLAALRAGLLAKSPRLPASPLASAAARESAGYPPGGRHELLSVRLAESAEGALLRPAHDLDLVLHLIASHHGRCRGFAPAVPDPRPVTVTLDWQGVRLTAASATGLERLDSGIAERFWTLLRRYGWWGLAFLEACLRLADHRASEDEDTEESAHE